MRGLMGKFSSFKSEGANFLLCFFVDNYDDNLSLIWLKLVLFSSFSITLIVVLTSSSLWLFYFRLNWVFYKIGVSESLIKKGLFLVGSNWLNLLLSLGLIWDAILSFGRPLYRLIVILDIDWEDISKLPRELKDYNFRFFIGEDCSASLRICNFTFFLIY